jgi:hypothetical protein
VGVRVECNAENKCDDGVKGYARRVMVELYKDDSGQHGAAVRKEREIQSQLSLH